MTCGTLLKQSAQAHTEQSAQDEFLHSVEISGGTKVSQAKLSFFLDFSLDLTKEEAMMIFECKLNSNKSKSCF